MSIFLHKVVFSHQQNFAMGFTGEITFFVITLLHPYISHFHTLSTK